MLTTKVEPWSPSTTNISHTIFSATTRRAFLEEENSRWENSGIHVEPQQNQSREVLDKRMAFGKDQGFFSLNGSFLDTQASSGVQPSSESSATSFHYQTTEHSNHEKNKSHRSPDIVLIEYTPEIQEIVNKSNQTPKFYRAGSSNITLPSNTSNWENKFINEEFTDATSESLSKPSKTKTGRRTGPLARVKREKASDMRKLGSCLRCRLAKTSVMSKLMGECCILTLNSVPKRKFVVPVPSIFQSFQPLYALELISETSQLSSYQVSTEVLTCG